MVDHDGIAAVVREVDARAGGLRHARGHFLHALLDQIPHLRFQGADRSQHLGGLRNHIAGVTGMEAADRQHRRFQRVDAARDDGLQGDHQLRAGEQRINALVRHRRMRALALDLDHQFVHRRHQRSRTDREAAERNAGNVVHAVDLIDGETIHQAILDHRRRTGTALFRGLEDHHRITGEIAGLGEIARRAEQHRGVAIVTAGMHLARRFRLIGQIGVFVDRQRVHIGAQADRLRAAARGRLAALDHADHAGLPQPGHDLIATELPETVGDKSGGPMHIIEEFGMGMQIPAPGHDVGLELGDTIDDGHNNLPKTAPPGGGATPFSRA